MASRKQPAAQYRLQLRAAEFEYEELQERARAAFDDFPTRVLVADYVEANPDVITCLPLATEHAVRMRLRNCRCASLAVYACWIAGAMFAAAATAWGIDKQLEPAVGSTFLCVLAGKVLPDMITTFYLKVEEKRLERWQKLRAQALATLLRTTEVANDVTPFRAAGGP